MAAALDGETSRGLPPPFSWRRTCALGLTLLATGCASRQFKTDDHLDATNDQTTVIKPCSLEQDQARKSAARDPDIVGLATPFIVKTVRPPAADRFVRNRDAIYFATSSDPPPGTIPPRWSLETLDPGGQPVKGSARLADENLIRLRPVVGAGTHGSGAIQQRGGASNIAPPFMIIKADVPDQNRPTTCDDLIRDGDYVFVHSISPSIWLGATPAGGLNVFPDNPMQPNDSKNGAGDPRCVQDKESCHTDVAGGVVCAWAPACAR